MKRSTFLVIVAATVVGAHLRAQVPQLVNYQGRIAVDAVNFNGAGQFKFALVSGGGQTLWSNDGTSSSGGEPSTAVTLTVTSGLYSVLLGDSLIGNMTPIPAGAFTGADVRLRVWFNDGAHGSQLLAPDQRLAPAVYLAGGAVTNAAIAPGAVNGTSVAPGSLNGANIASGSLSFNLLNVPSSPNSGQVLGFNGSSLVWQTPTAGNSVFSLNGTSAYYNAGNVGIGTANPQSKLHVSGTADAVRLTGSHPFLTLEDTAFGLYSRIEGNGAGLDLKTQGAVTGSNPSGLLHLDGAGNVGIGTTNPGTKLEVRTPTGYSGIVHTDGTRTIGTYLGSSASGADGGWLGTISPHPLHFFVNNGQPSLTIDTNGGRVGIGTTTPGTPLHVAGAATIDQTLYSRKLILHSTDFPLVIYDDQNFSLLNVSGNPPALNVYGNAYKSMGGTSWSVFSDQRLKQEVRSYDPGLKEILQLRPVRFRYRDNIKPGLTSSNKEIGFIAQEVQSVIPDAVTQDNDGYLMLKADPIHWAAINAIKELNLKLDQERTQNAQLRRRLENLEERLNQVEADVR